MRRRFRISDTVAALLSRAGSDDYETEPYVSGVVSTSAAIELRDRVVDLVGKPHADLAAALEQLRHPTPSKRDVDIALGLLRLESLPFELSQPNAAWRVLVALKHRTEVPETSDEDRRVIETVESFSKMDADSGFSELVRREPRLKILEESIQGADNSRQPRNSDNDPLLAIDREARQYMGPESENEDVLIRSRFALNAALLHLWKVTGLVGDP